MKKIILTAVIALGLCVASCSKDPKAEYVDIINDATEQIEKATSLEEMEKIANDVTQKEKDLKVSAAEGEKMLQDPEVKAALEKLEKASTVKAMELVANGSVSVEDLENFSME